MKTFQDLYEELKQQYGSADTSLNQISGGIKHAVKLGLIKPKSTSIDVGGGKFDEGKSHVEDNIEGSKFHVYDPYNRSEEHNKSVEKHLGKADYVSSHNVLNVIKEPEARRGVLEKMKAFMSPHSVGHVTVYEGDSSGNGRVSKQKGNDVESSWQEHRPTKSYVDEVKQVFPEESHNVIQKGKHIFISRKGHNPLDKDNLVPVKNIKRKPGKKMNEFYVHKDYVGETKIPKEEHDKALESLKKKHPDYEHNIVKHNPKTGAFSFMHSPDWDSADEPLVKHYVNVSKEGDVSDVRPSNTIYHQKWAFVGDNYKGFDVNKSKERTEKYKKAIDKLSKENGVPSAYYSRRIGNPDFWNKEVVPHIEK